MEISGTAKSIWMQGAGTSVQKGKLGDGEGEGEEGGGWRSKEKKDKVQDVLKWRLLLQLL